MSKLVRLWFRIFPPLAGKCAWCGEPAADRSMLCEDCAAEHGW